MKLVTTLERRGGIFSLRSRLCFPRLRHSICTFVRGKPSKQRAVLLLGLKQLAQEDADHLPVPDHSFESKHRARETLRTSPV